MMAMRPMTVPSLLAAGPAAGRAMVFNGARLESKFVYVSQRLRNLTAAPWASLAEPGRAGGRANSGNAHA
jgi:hypothetical protein